VREKSLPISLCGRDGFHLDATQVITFPFPASPPSCRSIQDFLALDEIAFIHACLVIGDEMPDADRCARAASPVK
jgi:hypothetical protein